MELLIIPIMLKCNHHLPMPAVWDILSTSVSLFICPVPYWQLLPISHPCAN